MGVVCMLCCTCVGDEIRALQKSLLDYSYQLTQLHQQLTSADRQRSTLQAKILSEEIMQQQVGQKQGILEYRTISYSMYVCVRG